MRISDWSSDVCSSDLVRRRTTAADYDETLVARLGGHSLRAGFVTQAFRNGADAHAIMRQTGHKTPGLPEGYAREQDRKRVVERTSVSISVDLGGRRIFQKKQQKHNTKLA